MKKIISLGIASAVLALTAMSASAAVVVKTDNAKVNPDAEIVVEFTVDTDSTGFQFNIAPVGLTFVSAEIPGGTVDGNKVTADGGLTQATATKYASVGAKSAGAVILRQTYKVTAKEGEAVAINITDAVNVAGETQNLTATVVAASGNESKPEESKPEESKPEESKPEDSKPNGGDNDNPNSGVALAVFPAIIAGAAVVVAKKRK